MLPGGIFMSFETQLLKASPSVLTAAVQESGVVTLAMALAGTGDDLISGAQGISTKLPERLSSGLSHAQLFLGPVMESEILRARNILLALIGSKAQEETIATQDMNPRQMTTGLRDLDQQIGPLRPGCLITVAARPGMGKSDLALNLVSNFSKRSGSVTAIFSFSSDRETVGARLLSISPCHSIGFDPMIFDDSAPLTVNKVAARCESIKRIEGKIDLVVIDYLQLMIGFPGQSRSDALCDIARRLKCLAKRLDCPVVVLSHISHVALMRQDKRPTLSDLRQSTTGSLDGDSDVVIFLYRDEVYDEGTPDIGVSEIIVAKNRAGECGTVKVGYSASDGRFVDLSPEACRG
jgi:replicative DNA helicase